MHRNRTKAKRNWPVGLYEQNGYFRLRRKDGTTRGLGRDKYKAMAVARHYNSIHRVCGDLNALCDYVLSNTTKITLSEYIDTFINDIIPGKGWSVSHTNNQLILIKKLKADKISSYYLDQITLKEISAFLDNTVSPNMHNRYRSILITIYKHAIDAGLVNENIPARKLEKKIVKRRQRLSLQDYWDVFFKAEPWLQNAMSLAIQTTQGVSEIANLKYSDIRNDKLFITRKKTNKYEHASIAISLTRSISQVINNSRDKYSSEYVIHKKLGKVSAQNMKNRTDRYQVTPQQISREFTKIIRTLDKYKHVSLKEIPTFHEIRSLAIYLYEKQGDDAQLIACHKDRKMTEHYIKGHKTEYINVPQMELDLSFPKKY